MTSSTLQLISCPGFIMTMVIIMTFAHERKTVPKDGAPELRAEQFKAQPNWLIKYN